MALADYIAFCTMILVALASPGPAFLVILRAALGRGRRAGLMVGLGLATMATTWTALALLGLGALFAAVPVLWLVLKMGGALYLIWLAFRIWRTADKPLPLQPQGGMGDFATGFLSNLANPKAVLFIAAIFATLLPEALSLRESVQVVSLHFALEICFYTLLTFGMTAQPVRRRYLAAKRMIDRIAALCLAGFAGRLLVGVAR